MTKSELAKEIKPIQDWLGGTKQEILDRGGEPKYPIRTLPEFNRKIWGLHKGLTTIGARSSMGKSAFALQLSWDLADQNIPVLLLSLEMDVPSMIERIFCQQTQTDNFDLLSGKLNFNPDLQAKWDFFEKWISQIPLLLTNGIGKSFAEVNQLIALLDPKPKVVIVDYIQGIRQSEKERAELNEYIRNFRQLMIENKMVGVLASQMNRMTTDNVDKRPSLENLKSTGVLEEHCLVGDTLIYCKERDKYYTIKEIYEKQDFFEVKTYDFETNEVKYVKPNKILKKGKLECFKVRTKSGKEIIVSKGTQFYNGTWKVIEDLEAGDVLFMHEGDEIEELPYYMEIESIEYIGERDTYDFNMPTGCFFAQNFLVHNSDIVLMLYWGYFYTRKDEDINKYEIIVGKNRNGRTGVHELVYVPQNYLFKECGQHLAESMDWKE